MQRSKKIPTIILALGLGLAALPAHAQPTEEEAAAATPTAGVSLAEASKAQKFQAKQYLDAGKKDADRSLHERALVKFRQSYGIVKSPGTRLRIVRELIDLKRFVQAHREAVLGRQEAVRATQVDPNFAGVVEQYDADLVELEPQVALVMVGVAGGADGAALTIDGAPLAAELWAQPFAVEAGPHTIVVTKGGEKMEGKVTAAVGKTETVTLGAAEDDGDSAPAPVAAPPPSLEPVEEDASGGYDGPDRFGLGLIAASVGAVGFVNFGIFGMLSNGQLTRLEDACPDRRCDPALAGEADSGKTYNTVANVGLAVGAIGVAAGAGLILWDILDPAEGEASASGPAVTDVAVGPGAFTVKGQF